MPDITNNGILKQFTETLNKSIGNTKRVDPNGTAVLYSMTSQRFLSPNVSGIIEEVSEDTTIFTNGQWKYLLFQLS